MSTRGGTRLWQKPTLILLVRGDPAENLTTYCKRNWPRAPATTQTRNNQYCRRNNCNQNCNDRTGS